VEIEREGQRRVGAAGGDVSGSGRALGEVVADAERRLRDAVPLPQGYELAVGGDAEQQRENQRNSCSWGWWPSSSCTR
jgi:Cu/Ag efflux pump CusA